MPDGASGLAKELQTLIKFLHLHLPTKLLRVANRRNPSTGLSITTGLSSLMPTTTFVDLVDGMVRSLSRRVMISFRF